jgi:hypothetical protein
MIESQPSPTSRKTAPPAVSAWRIRFVADAPADARILRQFVDPAPTVAASESIDPANLPTARVWPEPVDELYAVHVPNAKAFSAPAIGPQWLLPPDQPGAALACVVPVEGGRILWRPGRLLIEGNVKLPEQILAAVADFAFYEGQLRKIEQAVRAFEATAPSDVPRSYRISSRDQDRWPALVESAEQLSLLRLTAARLEPRAFCPPRDLPRESRRLVSRLAARADIEDRLEALSARLEACEDLYEGAADRITDHKWARKGNRLEIAIVALLLIEVILIIGDLLVRLFHNQPK